MIIEKIDYPSILGNNPYPKEYDENKKYENGEYPYTYKLTNDIINNMDFPYDYFLNPIKFYSFFVLVLLRHWPQKQVQ